MTTLFTFQAIETRYHGYRFRSRLEARSAVFLDALGTQYRYEHEGYDLEGTWYLPDFYLPEQDCFVEVTSAPWINPGVSHPHEWAFLLRWKVRLLLLEPSRLTLPPQALAFPEPQGSFSISKCSGTWLLFPHCQLGFYWQQKKESVYVGEHASVFTERAIDLSNPAKHYSVVSVLQNYSFTGAENRKCPRYPCPKQGLTYIPMPEGKGFTFVEIKGQAPEREEREKTRLLALYTQKRVCTFSDTIAVPHDGEKLTSFLDRPAQLWTYHASEYDVGGPSTTQLHVPSYILALLQKLEESSIALSVSKDGELMLTAGHPPHAVDRLDDLLALLHRQHRTLIEVRDVLEEKTEEIAAAQTPADGWRIVFFPQEAEELEDDCLWCACDTCGKLDIRSPFADTHCCNDTTLGRFLPDTPRLIEAGEAARSARF